MRRQAPHPWASTLCRRVAPDAYAPHNDPQSGARAGSRGGEAQRLLAALRRRGEREARNAFSRAECLSVANELGLMVRDVEGLVAQLNEAGEAREEARGRLGPAGAERARQRGDGRPGRARLWPCFSHRRDGVPSTVAPCPRASLICLWTPLTSDTPVSRRGLPSPARPSAGQGRRHVLHCGHARRRGARGVMDRVRGP